MKVSVIKENQAFSIEAIGIKTREDIQEIIHQCRFVENQLSDELNHFAVTDDGTLDKT